MQAFAYDIVMAHDRERAERGGERAAPGVLQRLRMFLTGTAGTGKSRTVRAFVQARREAAEVRAEEELRGAGEIAGAWGVYALIGRPHLTRLAVSW